MPTTSAPQVDDPILHDRLVSARFAADHVTGDRARGEVRILPMHDGDRSFAVRCSPDDVDRLALCFRRAIVAGFALDLDPVRAERVLRSAPHPDDPRRIPA